MGTYTAQILVGHSHPYHGGIKPSHILFLSENGRSAWCLYPILESPQESSKFFENRVWICDPYTLLEDAMLMIGLFIRKNNELIKLAENFNKELLNTQHLEIFSVLSEKQRMSLYQKSKEISWTYLKVSISVFEGSSLRNISKLKEYNDLEFEVCVSFYLRDYNSFSNTFKIRDKTKDDSFWKRYLDVLKGE